MKDVFFPMSDEYRQKHYPNGYFAWVAKKSGGGVLIVCGVILALIGVSIGFGAFSTLQDILSGDETEGLGGLMAFLTVFALLFLVPGILVIRYGWKRKTRGAEGWIKKCAKESGYSEGEIREFEEQINEPQTIRFELCGAQALGSGFLTRDYVMFENFLKPCVIKVRDVAKAYVVLLPNLAKRYNQETPNVAVFSNRKTFMVMGIRREEDGEKLISMLTEKNSQIDAAPGRMLSSEEYDQMVAECTR